MINILAKAKQANVVFFNSEKWTQASHLKLQDEQTQEHGLLRSFLRR